MSAPHRQCSTLVRYNLIVNPLNDLESRVLGALVEKDITTPTTTTFSLNALISRTEEQSRTGDEPGWRRAAGTLDSLQGESSGEPAAPAARQASATFNAGVRLPHGNRSRVRAVAARSAARRTPRTRQRMHRFEALDECNPRYGG